MVYGYSALKLCVCVKNLGSLQPHLKKGSKVFIKKRSSEYFTYLWRGADVRGFKSDRQPPSQRISARSSNERTTADSGHSGSEREIEFASFTDCSSGNASKERDLSAMESRLKINIK